MSIETKKSTEDEINDDNMDVVLDNLKSFHFKFFDRTQLIDNRNNFLLVLQGVFLVIIFNLTNISNNHYINCCCWYTKGIIGIYILLVISAVVLSIISICIYINSLKSSDISSIPMAICDKQYLSKSNHELKLDLISTYKTINQNNEKTINKKHGLYSKALNCTFAEAIVLGIILIIKILFI